MNKLRVFLATIGLFVSAYLLYTYVRHTPIVCSTNGCDIVRHSEFSHVLGIPLPFFGLLFYLALIFLFFLGPTHKKILKFKTEHLILLFALVGFLYSAYLTSLEAFVIHAFCDWCLISAVISTLIFLFSIEENFYKTITDRDTRIRIFTPTYKKSQNQRKKAS